MILKMMMMINDEDIGDDNDDGDYDDSCDDSVDDDDCDNDDEDNGGGGKGMCRTVFVHCLIVQIFVVLSISKACVFGIVVLCTILIFKS